MNLQIADKVLINKEALIRRKRAHRTPEGDDWSNSKIASASVERDWRSADNPGISKHAVD